MLRQRVATSTTQKWVLYCIILYSSSFLSFLLSFFLSFVPIFLVKMNKLCPCIIVFVWIHLECFSQKPHILVMKVKLEASWSLNFLWLFNHRSRIQHKIWTMCGGHVLFSFTLSYDYLITKFAINNRFGLCMEDMCFLVPLCRERWLFNHRSGIHKGQAWCQLKSKFLMII